MKRWIAVLVVLLAVAPGARADDASKRAKVQELFVTMHMDRMMSQIMDMVMKQTRQVTQGMPGADKMTPEQMKLVEQFQAKVEGMVNETLGWKALEPDYIKLYADTYSEEEIDGILTFYKSPVGQTLLAKTPELTAKSGAIVQAKMVDFQPKMKALMEDFMKQVEATVPKDSTAPATTKKPMSH
jgi:hypothetical protein